MHVLINFYESPRIFLVLFELFVKRRPLRYIKFKMFFKVNYCVEFILNIHYDISLSKLRQVKIFGKKIYRL